MIPSFSPIIQTKYIRDLLGHRYSLHQTIPIKSYENFFVDIFTDRYSLLYNRLMGQTHYEDQRYRQV